MSKLPDVDFTALAKRYHKAHEHEALRLREAEPKAAAIAKAQTVRSRQERQAEAIIEILLPAVLPTLERAKAGFEAAGLNAVISLNWDDAGQRLPVEPAVRFQCSGPYEGDSETDPAGAYPSIDSKVAVFVMPNKRLDCRFEGPDAQATLVPRPAHFASNEELVSWATEEVLASYYQELAKITYLKP